ncbi:geranylgeranyl pyrophosphate synthetase [Orbilia oligospora]|uniref:Geranylgeranyl pyrophosphate synthetase n=1 Tax=Orbilia oligospora TaxID=2813651 RepID=A0A7C8PEA3_ORBOL|nr:geranylgeranyl pyrophosphate synthetase [Orbilia oligospora]
MEARDSSLSSTNRSAAVQSVQNNGIGHSKTPSNGIPPHLLYGSPTGYSTVTDMTHSEQKGPRDFSLNVIKRPWSDAKEQAVCGPYDYLVSLPGKDIRSKLIDAFNIYLQVPEESLGIIKHVVAMLHNASLLVDDVEDHSVLRRGYPVAHSLFGVAQTINSANYIYFRAMQDITGLKSPVCVQVFTEELINLHRGQGMDLFWRDTLTCPSEDDYLEMVSNKTGGLFRLAIKLMQAESASEVDYLDLVNLMGLIFQIRDDYMNLQSDQMINILKQQTQDDGVKHYAVAYMRDQTKSFEYTASVLKDLQEQATGLLDSFGDNVALRAILENLKVDA